MAGILAAECKCPKAGRPPPEEPCGGRWDTHPVSGQPAVHLLVPGWLRALTVTLRDGAVTEPH